MRTLENDDRPITATYVMYMYAFGKELDGAYQAPCQSLPHVPIADFNTAPPHHQTLLFAASKLQVAPQLGARR